MLFAIVLIDYDYSSRSHDNRIYAPERSNQTSAKDCQHSENGTYQPKILSQGKHYQQQQLFTDFQLRFSRLIELHIQFDCYTLYFEQFAIFICISINNTEFLLNFEDI